MEDILWFLKVFSRSGVSCFKAQIAFPKPLQVRTEWASSCAILFCCEAFSDGRCPGQMPRALRTVADICRPWKSAAQANSANAGSPASF
jgi:hypothetical protein